MNVSRVSAQFAADCLQGMEALDPRGLTEPGQVAQMCADGECYVVSGASRSAVFVAVRGNGTLWVEAAAGSGAGDCTEALAEALPRIAGGARRVAFQTARRGLVAKAERHGYRVTGWILTKDMQ